MSSIASIADLVYTGLITLGLSGFLAYMLDRRREKMNTLDKKRQTYLDLIDKFLSKSKKTRIDIQLINSVIIGKRSYLKKSIRDKIPSNFPGLYASTSKAGFVDGYGSGSATLRDLNGKEISGFKTNDGKSYSTFIWFKERREYELWIEVANEILSDYNKLFNDNLKIEEWAFRAVPK